MTNLNNALLDALTSHKIAITEQTATLLLAVEKFEFSIENLVKELSDKTDKLELETIEVGNVNNSDAIDEFLKIVEPAETWLFRKVGFSLVKSLYFKSSESDFEGL